MDDLGRVLTPLADRPLAAPPSIDELERRARHHRRRRWAGRGIGVTAVSVLVAGVALSLTSGEPRTTVRATAPGGGRAPGAQEASAVGGPRPIPLRTEVVEEFDVGGRRWQLVALEGQPKPFCLELRSEGVGPIPAGCWAVPEPLMDAAATDGKTFSFVSGVATKDVTAIEIETAPGEPPILPAVRHVGYPVSFFGAVVPLTTEVAEIRAVTASGAEQRVTLTTPGHKRVASINGEPAPPGSIATTPPPSAVARPTTTVPATPTTTAPPPTGGGATRVDVVPGATRVHKHPFESVAGYGSQAVAARWWGGVAPCDVLARVDVVETGTTVTITLWSGTAPGSEDVACIAMAQYKEHIGTLDAPLAGRTIVDGAA
ncbi:MAG: hypothetical protein M3144_03490 [Actinomycetota bacterium]|nr:hypothetical protein [Actinomycetota bacterium]